MLFRTKKQFLVIRNCQHIFNKNRPMELDADEPRKFQGPPDRILGADMGEGGGGAKFWLGGEGKSEDSFWRRDLSVFGPFGAEANWLELKGLVGLPTPGVWATNNMLFSTAHTIYKSAELKNSKARVCSASNILDLMCCCALSFLPCPAFGGRHVV